MTLAGEADTTTPEHRVDTRAPVTNFAIPLVDVDLTKDLRSPEPGLWAASEPDMFWLGTVSVFVIALFERSFLFGCGCCTIATGAADGSAHALSRYLRCLLGVARISAELGEGGHCQRRRCPLKAQI